MVAVPEDKAACCGDACCTTGDRAPLLPVLANLTQEQVAAIGRAISDPIRLRMLGLMALGRSCCDLPACNVPAPEAGGEGICVCEFTAYYGLAQSKVSYHLKSLKDAGLVLEETRGKWTFYTLNRKMVRQALAHLGQLMGTESEAKIDG